MPKIVFQCYFEYNVPMYTICQIIVEVKLQSYYYFWTAWGSWRYWMNEKYLNHLNGYESNQMPQEPLLKNKFTGWCALCFCVIKAARDLFIPLCPKD